MTKAKFRNPFAAMKAEELDNETILEWFTLPRPFDKAFLGKHEIVTGGRGCGKTILLKYLAAAYKQSHEVTEPIVEGSSLPIAVYCDLRDFSQEFNDANQFKLIPTRAVIGYYSLFLLRELALTFDKCLSDGLRDRSVLS